MAVPYEKLLEMKESLYSHYGPESSVLLSLIEEVLSYREPPNEGKFPCIKEPNCLYWCGHCTGVYLKGCGK